MQSFYTLKWLVIVSLLGFAACSPKPSGLFIAEKLPAAPNYADTNAWAALPFTKDSADIAPKGLQNRQDVAAVDVFFLYPTSYTGKAGENEWNAAIDDPKTANKTDRTSIKFQSSIFNGAARVYAPRYRQAHLYSFFTEKDKRAAADALAIAYQDVKAAFEYYLEHYNQGRPIIIAGHSQGGLHGRTLLKEYFDGKPLQDQLVVAYLVGYPVMKDQYDNIPVCESAEQTGCFCSWRTFKTGYTPKKGLMGDSVAVVNPLNWTTSKEPVAKSENKGAIITDIDKIQPENVGAQIENGLLWTNKPKFRGSIFFWTKNYHPGDFNLFYMNVRENVEARVKAYLQQKN
ncbi:MAG: DUF3089 domain-containing protein [Saprospiraceae bacterium]|nr:DUF3089 domain-containing protein [Saprospiraceae bacterium]